MTRAAETGGKGDSGGLERYLDEEKASARGARREMAMVNCGGFRERASGEWKYFEPRETERWVHGRVGEMINIL